MRALWGTPVGRMLVALVVGFGLAAVVGMAVLWPSGDETEISSQRLPTNTETAEVERIVEEPCEGLPTRTCRTVEFELESGPDEGTTASFELQAGPPLDPELDVGDRIRVASAPAPDESERSYRLADFERRSPMIWLAIAFALLVVVFGRLRGAMSLVGLVVSLGIILAFIVPAIAQGEEPVAVAIVGSLAIMLTTIVLAHGVGVKSLAAILGTGVTLALVALLALAFTNLTHLTGLSTEYSVTLSVGLGISLEGLLLAGMVVGALGVLDDVTVSQASTVLALRAANLNLGFGALYRRAIDVGRDHVSAAVNTLVLAYAGAALPIMLIFTVRGIGFDEAVNFEIVAKEIVAMLVGSIGLIAAVPLTTALAALLAVRLPPEVLPSPDGDHHGHVH